MTPCFLAHHAYLTTGPRHVVILDLHRDKYVCIPLQRFEQLTPCLGDWPVARDSRDISRASISADAASLAAELVTCGILTHDPADAKPVRPTAATLATAQVRSGRRPRCRTILVDTVPFVLACRRADLALQRLPIETVVARVATRNHSRATPVTSASIVRMIELTRSFDALRPVYPRPYLCLFDSLALLEFLSLHHLHPRWIFGVRAEPFHAHCWVQHGDVLLNDRLDRLLTLSTIMAV